RRHAPVAALDATFALVDDRAWKWRARLVAGAPKIVMKTIAGMTDPRAWALRDQVAAHCEETFDSIAGIDDARAWALREAHAGTWPWAVAKSLGMLMAGERGRALLAAVLARHPRDLALWRNATVL